MPIQPSSYHRYEFNDVAEWALKIYNPKAPVNCVTLCKRTKSNKRIRRDFDYNPSIGHSGYAPVHTDDVHRPGAEIVF